MKLKNASICLDCDEVFVSEWTKGICPICASRASAPMSRWLPTMPIKKIADCRNMGQVRKVHGRIMDELSGNPEVCQIKNRLFGKGEPCLI